MSKLSDTQLADLSYIARYADSIKEKLVNRGEDKFSPLLVHLDRIAELARNLRENLKDT